MKAVNAIAHYLPALMKGTVITLEVMVYSTLLAFMLAFITGLARLSKYWIVRTVFTVYVEAFRGTSLLVQLFWAFYVLPFFDITLTPMQAGVLAIGLNYAAYGSEVVRSSILAVPKGQTEASIAVNFTPIQRMRLVILPQAFIRMVPPFGNLLIELLKATALVSLITLSDVTHEAMMLKKFNISDTTLILTLLLVIYFVIAYMLNLGMRWVERKVTVGRL